MLGISTGFFCAGICLPLLTPLMMLNIKKSLKQGLIIFGLFGAGRLVAYSLFGLSTGLAGFYLSELVAGPYIISISLIITSLLLLFFTYSNGKCFSFCLNKKTFENTTYLPLILGFLTGINICPPFLMAIPAIFRLASPTLGLLFFLSFFVGTTLFLLPSFFGLLIGKIKMLTPLIKIITIFIGLYFLTIGLSSFKNLIIFSKPHQQIEESDIIDFFPDANVIQVTPFHNSVFSAHSKNNLLGYIIISDGFGSFTGFSGPLTVGISTDPDFKLNEVKILSHNEGTPYMKLLEDSGFLKQFKNKTPACPLMLDTDINAVTGATASSSAILNTVKTSYKKASSLVTGQKVTLQKPVYYSPFSVIVIFIPFISCLLYIFYKKEYLRYFTMFYALIVLGFWKKTMLTGEQIANALTSNIFSPDQRFFLLFFAFIIIITVFFGNKYCSFICPFGTIQRFAGKISKKKIPVPGQVANFMGKTKFILLFTIIIIYTLTIKIPPGRFEPFSTTFSLRGDFLAWALVSACILSSIFINMFWCRFFCPAGAFQKIISTIGRSSEKK